MQRRSFFKSLTTKAKKLAVHNCYEINIDDCIINVYINNPHSNIILIDKSEYNTKKHFNFNYSYININNIKNIIKSLKKQFPNLKISLLSAKYTNADVEEYVLINQERRIEKTGKKVLFAYDYNYLQTAQNYYKLQENANKDIFISQLFEDNKITEVFAQRLAQVD